MSDADQPEPKDEQAKTNDGKLGRLVMKISDGELITIGDDVQVRLNRARPGRADVSVTAPKSMKIWRHPKQG